LQLVDDGGNRETHAAPTLKLWIRRREGELAR
jgi:hypothetical protein